MADTVVIDTKLGKLRGSTKLTKLSGKKYHAFQGIPYAKPPIGNLRFKAPQPFGGWEGVRDALKDGHQAVQPVRVPQPGMKPGLKTDGSEDCLILNVYIKELPNNTNVKTPVLFWIHGGGFLLGSGGETMSGPDLLLEENVVVVSINYRLGAFGFLSLENDTVPGNAGMKDQNLALRWVRENITSFGGDPNNITIFGISAGGASVNHHLLSPSSAGLFHKAIIQSGFSTNPWAVQKEPRAAAVKLARQLGCQSDNDQDILTFLQAVSAEDIVTATNAISKDKYFPETLGLLFVPCVEVAGPNAFLSEHPGTLLQRGDFNKVPVILGGTVKEGSVLSFFDALIDEEFENVNKNPDLLVPSFIKSKEDKVVNEKISKELWDFYLKGKPVSWDSLDDFLKLESDVMFNYGLEYVRDCLLERSSMPVYRYLFTNHSKCYCSLLEGMIENPEHLSKIITAEACHGADSNFLISSSFSTQYSDEDRQAIKNHVFCWTSFAKTGDPNWSGSEAVWSPDSLTKPCYMEIGTQWTMRDSKPFDKRIDF